MRLKAVASSGNSFGMCRTRTELSFLQINPVFCGRRRLFTIFTVKFVEEGGYKIGLAKQQYIYF